MNPATLATRRMELPEIESALRTHLAQHNGRVAAIALATLLAAIVLWAAFYFVAQWLTLLALVSTTGADVGVPRTFPAIFTTAAVCLLAYAWIDRRLTPNERARDETSGVKIVEDFVLAVPRVTLSAFSTLGAWQTLRPSEIARAAALLDRLAAERRVALHGLALEIPDTDQRLRILFALQLAQIIDLRRSDGQFFLTLNPLRPAALPLPSPLPANPGR